jgi:hypothetical protein
MDRDLAALPSDAILFNMEQVSQDMPFVTKGYITTLKSFQVWDIDDRNILALRGLGVRDIDLCQIGYVPELTRINPAPVKDIDVLFYGSINDRRRHVLRQLHDKGLKVALQFNAYGQQRDQIIARSKVVMNIHSYAAKVFEIVRISYLWANQVCVASEYSPGVSDQLREGMLEASYDELAEAVWDLLQDALKREQIAETGFHRFSAIRQEHVLPGCVLAETRSESEIA